MINRRELIAGLATVALARPTIAAETVDYASWTDLLGRYLKSSSDGITRVNYRSWNQHGQAQLDAFVQALEAVDVRSLGKAQQFAFWINLYNAKTIAIILEHYPVASIRDIDLGGGFFADGPWSAKLLKVAGQSLSLDDIEHKILRKSWKDPRIHYAVNCASIGCPNLQVEAFTANNIENLLNSGAVQYINNRRGLRIKDKGLVASKIYQWFADDFGSREDLNAHWISYAGDPLKQAIKSIPPILSYEYDWSLNEAG